MGGPANQRQDAPNAPLLGDRAVAHRRHRLWVILRDVLWFVGFMSLYAIWITHLAGWAAETPVEEEAPVEEAEATTNAPEPAATSQEAAA